MYNLAQNKKITKSIIIDREFFQKIDMKAKIFALLLLLARDLRLGGCLAMCLFFPKN